MNYLTTEGIYIMYLRKSRADEKLAIENVLEKHESELQLLAERELGYRIPENYIFREIVSGGTLKDRPLIQEILKMMESGIVKGVLVVDPQRLTRGDMLDQGHIINAFKYTNTLIMTPYKTYDLNDSTGTDMKLLKMELDHGADYLDYYKMIQRRGKMASVREGNFVQATPPYGYKKVHYSDGTNTLKIVEDHASVVRLIFQKYFEGKTICQVTNEINLEGYKSPTNSIWNKNSVKRILSNPVYDGKIRWGYTPIETILEDGELKTCRREKQNYMIFEGKHDAIVDHDIFLEVQKRLSTNKSFTDDKTIKNPLYGIMYCKRCGRKISRLNVALEKGGYRYSCQNKLCNVQSSKYSLVIDAVIDALKSVINDFEIILPETKNIDLDKKIQELRQELNTLNVKEETLFELLETKVYSTEIFTKRHAELERKRQEIINKINSFSSMEQPESRDEKKSRFKDALNALNDPSILPKEKNNLLKKCIDRIDYDVEGKRYHSKIKLDIHFKF